MKNAMKNKATWEKFEGSPGVYEVIAGNIGTVYNGPYKDRADAVYNEYKELSKKDYGRAAGENIMILSDGEPIKEYMAPKRLTAMVSDYCLPDYWTGHSGNVIIAYPYFELTRPELIDELMDDLGNLYTGDDEYCIPESITNEEIYKALDNEIAHFEKFGDIFPDAPKLDDIDDCMDSPVLYVILSVD